MAHAHRDVDEKALSHLARIEVGSCSLWITGPLLETFVGIVKDRPTFKAANLSCSFTALGQNIINEALMSTSRLFGTDAGFCLCVPNGPCFHGHFT